MREASKPAIRNPKKDSISAPLLASLGAATLLLGLMEIIFVALSPAIAARPATPTSQHLIVPWARWAVAERDGIETYVLLAGILAFLAAAATLTFILRNISERAAIRLGIAGAVAAAAITFRTQSSEFFPLKDSFSRILFVLIAASLMLAWNLIHARSSPFMRQVCLIAALAVFSGMVVLSLPQPSMADYGYFIGPALKLLQGEGFGTFYMQYGLLETLLVTGMVAAGLKAHVMQLLLSFLFIGWYILYWLVARRLFQDRFLALLCMAALVTARFLAITGHPVSMPQVLPIRLDLWAPLLLAVMAWGLTSWRTSLAFGAAYAFDATFGFLFAAVYAGSLLTSWWYSERGRASLSTRTLLLLPAAAAGIFQKVVFGSWIWGAATYYLDLQIGFLPVSSTSLFWPVVMLLGWCVVVFALRHTEPGARLGLLLCAFAAVQCIYFFGRSHDHNLLNISAVWLFPVFLAVDQAVDSIRWRKLAGTAVVLVLMTMSTLQFVPKFARVRDRLERRVWIEPVELEATLEMLRGTIGPDTIFADPSDAYMNYRLRVAQRGFYVPFYAHIFIDETAEWMDEQVGAGMRILTYDFNWSTWIKDFNDSAAMKRRGRHFSVAPSDSFLEITAQDNR